ncbi:HNH endonuclease [Jiella sonneratiae]|nr:HNH endonuclease [Jiella sonneratiae]
MTVPVHPICHRTLHATFSNVELARMEASGEAIRERPELRPFIRWIAGKPPDFHAPTRRRR